MQAVVGSCTQLQAVAGNRQRRQAARSLQQEAGRRQQAGRQAGRQAGGQAARSCRQEAAGNRQQAAGTGQQAAGIGQWASAGSSRQQQAAGGSRKQQAPGSMLQVVAETTSDGFWFMGGLNETWVYRPSQPPMSGLQVDLDC